ALEVEVNHVLEAVRVPVLERVRVAPARVVHQHVDATERLQRLVNEVFALLDVAHVGGDDVRAPPGLCLHLGGDAFQVLDLATGEHHVGPVLREQQRSGRADARSAAGDDGNLAGV